MALSIIVTRYFNNSLATGLNDGTSEANAWQDMTTAIAAINILLATNSVQFYAKDGGTPLYLGSTTSWSFTTSEGNILIFSGYSIVPGDNGKFSIDLNLPTVLTFTAKSSVLENISITTSYQNGPPFLFRGAGAILRNSKINNSASGCLSLVDNVAYNNELIGGYSGGADEIVTLYRAIFSLNRIESHDTSGTRDGILLRDGYRANICYGNIIAGISGGIGLNIDGGSVASESKVTNNTISGFTKGIRVIEARPAGKSVTNLLLNIIANCTTGIINETANVNDQSVISFKNAFYNCATDMDTGTSIDLVKISLTNDPFVDSANFDLTLNDDPIGGVLVKDMGPNRGLTLNLGAMQ